MMLLYPFKRIFRSWKLFLALLIGVVLASAFFAGIDVKTNLAARQVMDEQLERIQTDMEFHSQLNFSDPLKAKFDILNIEGVEEVEFFYTTHQPSQLLSENFTNQYFINTIAIPNNSVLQNEWSNRPTVGIGENETYILKNTPFAERVDVGDIIQTSFDFLTPNFGNRTEILVNLTVAGFATFSDEGYMLVSGNTFFFPTFQPNIPVQTFDYRFDLMLLGWETTVEKIWSTMNDTALQTKFLMSVDRENLISPWDTQTSTNNLQTIGEGIQNTVLGNFDHHVYVQNNLENALQSFQYNFPNLYLAFLLVSFPVFFVAWYLGSTVTDVSFNLRRREIGLLATRGLSSGQIKRMFFTEALLIGLIGGLLGLIGGLLLNQVFSGFNLETLFNPQTFSPHTIVLTVFFGIGLSFFSVFFSARRAVNLPAVDALKEYVSIETTKPYRKRLPWIAFLLGAFKIILFILGVNLSNLLISSTFGGGGNYMLSLLLSPLLLLDQALTYFGPLLFFWGFTKLFIQGSLKFQQLSSKVSGVMGDLGVLASKNVKRNPARSAAIAFLIALILGYGVQVTAQVASETDYAYRRVKYEVGADIAVSVVNETKADVILGDILGNVSGIRNSTIECTLSQNYAGTIMKTIDPDSWLETAYYEKEWFGGTSFEEMFYQLRVGKSNMTIILERRVADDLNLTVGDEIGIDFPSDPRKLKIVGLFGPKSAEPSPNLYYFIPTWSYIPRNLFNMTSPFSDAFILEDFQTRLLFRLEVGVNGSIIAQNIRDLDLEIYGVESFDEELAKAQGNPVIGYSLQILDVQRLGLLFAVVAASAGTGLISIVSMKERSREATIMSVKGLSYKQLVGMFLTENLAVVVFSIVLGLSVGFIAGYGSIVSSNTIISELVQRRFIFPYDSWVVVVSYVLMILASTIFPILIISRQYVTKLERMIRVR